MSSEVSPQKEILKMLVESMLFVAVCDKDLDRNELELINDVIKINWKTEYGDAQKFIHEIAVSVRKRNPNSSDTYKKIEQSGKIMARIFTEERKEQVIKVLKKLILADKYIHQREKKLLNTFQDALYSSKKG